MARLKSAQRRWNLAISGKRHRQILLLAKVDSHLKQVTDFTTFLCLLDINAILFQFNPITGLDRSVLLAKESRQRQGAWSSGTESGLNRGTCYVQDNFSVYPLDLISQDVTSAVQVLSSVKGIQTKQTRSGQRYRYKGA